MDGKTLEDKLAAARARHGRDFRTDERVPRETPKSAFLRRLERQQRPAAPSRAPVLELRRTK